MPGAVEGGADGRSGTAIGAIIGKRGISGGSGSATPLAGAGIIQQWPDGACESYGAQQLTWAEMPFNTIAIHSANNKLLTPLLGPADKVFADVMHLARMGLNNPNQDVKETLMKCISSLSHSVSPECRDGNSQP